MIATLTINPSVDTSTTIEYVTANEKLRCDPPRHDPGGGGINVARAIHRLGGEATAVFPVGGPLGRYLTSLLEAEGLTPSTTRVRGMTRENLTVTETGSGHQYRFGMPGPELAESEWQACLDALERLRPTPSFIVVSGSLPPGVPVDYYARVARLGRSRGARVVVDSSGAPLRSAVEEGVGLLKPNVRELAHIAGHDVDDDESIEAAARALVERGAARVVIVSLGAGGVLVATADGAEHVRAPTVAIKSRIGAGDSMVAGVVHALDQGRSVASATRYGVAAGTAAVMTPGTELCRRDDVERLFQHMTENGV